MKKYFYSTLLCSMLVATSCSDFLTEESKTNLTEEQVYGDEAKIRLVVSGLYTKWRNTRQDRGGLYLTLGTDEGKQGGQQVNESGVQASLDKYNGAFDAPNSVIGDLWNKRWPVVPEAAKVIEYSTDTKVKARASFLRGAVNFELAMLWGEIPLITIQNLREARQPLKDVYELIIADLEFAVANLPAPGQESDPKFPTSGAAQALLGKVYMYAPVESTYRDFGKAIEHFDQAIPHYALLGNYSYLFDTQHENSSESIYAFQFVNLYPDNNMVQHHAGSRAVADVDGKTYFGGYDLCLPTEHYYKDIDEGGVWEDGDTRKAASIRYDFTLPDGRIPGITWTGQADELEPHVKKFEDPRTQGVQGFWDGGVDIYYLRLADILLCKAECLNELGQTPDAVSLVNTTVRTRAFGGVLPAEAEWSASMSQEDFRTNIMEERMRELAFEGWRRMDLIRTGKFVELVKERNKWANQSGTIQAFHALYPIPESEIKQNALINEEDQNPGYE